MNRRDVGGAAIALAVYILSTIYSARVAGMIKNRRRALYPARTERQMNKGRREKIKKSRLYIYIYALWLLQTKRLNKKRERGGARLTFLSRK